MKLALSSQEDNETDTCSDRKMSDCEHTDHIVALDEDQISWRFSRLSKRYCSYVLVCMLHLQNLKFCCRIGLRGSRTFFLQGKNWVLWLNLFTWIVAYHLVFVYRIKSHRFYIRFVCAVDVTSDYRSKVEYAQRQCDRSGYAAQKMCKDCRCSKRFSY